MNAGRLAIAAVAAAVADMAYGFVAYGVLLANQFAAYPGVYRPAADTSYMGYLFGGILLAMFPAAYIYAKGYEGRGGLTEGLRFGCVMGTLMLGYGALVNYSVLNIGFGLGAGMAAVVFVEWLLVGVVIGLVYKPAAVPARRAATV